jgi:peptidoglycan/LPS O-acetylase OafA/YrhL
LTKPLSPHHNNFTLLRHIAAFFVLYAHCITVNGEEEFIYRLTYNRLELSSLGVRIFFILSGYLVTKSLLQSRRRIDFARKRLLRLWPALIAVTFVLSFVAGPVLSNLSLSAYFRHPQTWNFFFRNILFVPVYHLPGVLKGEAINSTFWTLFFEVVCYFSLIVLGKRFLLQKAKTIALVWLIVVIWKYAIPPLFVWPLIIQPYVYGISDMMFLFYSAGLWLLLPKEKNYNSRIIYLVAAAIFLFSLMPLIPLKLSIFLQDAGLLFFITEWGRSKAIFSWPAWDISYGTYLIGFPIEMIAVYQFNANMYGAIMVFIATLLITIPLAFASWFIVEKPALHLKQSMK